MPPLLGITSVMVVSQTLLYIVGVLFINDYTLGFDPETGSFGFL